MLSGLSTLNRMLNITGLSLVVNIPLGADHHQNAIKTWLQ